VLYLASKPKIKVMKPSRFLPLAALSLLLVTSAAQGQTNRLFILPTMSGSTFNLTMAPSSHEFFSGSFTSTLGFSGSFLGPTLIFEQGDQVQMNVSNQIGEPTTVHWHGMHVASQDDGGPHTVIADGAVWSLSFTILDRATTF
jgi:blue copper oxidase